MAEDLPSWLQYSPESQLDEPVETLITGEVPKWLSGTLYRNGSGMFKVGQTTVKHLFDGMAVLHKFVIQDGKVHYQQKLLDSETLKACLKADRLVVSQFATAAYPDPCKNIFSRYFSYFLPINPGLMDNTAVNIVPHGDMLVAMTETTDVNIIDPETLQRKETVGLGDIVAVHIATAHPHTDEEGNMYNLGSAFNPQKAYNIIKIPPQEKGGDNPLHRATLVSTFPSRWKFNISYNHSFGMSENYFVVLEQTLTINSLKLPLAKFIGYAACMSNYSNEKLIIHLVRRSDGKTVNTCYTAEAFFCFHFINCYEEDGHVIIDLCAYDNGDVVFDLYLSDLKEGKLGKYFANVRRYVLPLTPNDSQESADKNLVTLKDTSATAVRQADGTILCGPDYIVGGAPEGVVMELPRINYSYNTRKYRYIYGTGFLTDKPYLTKLDLQTKTVSTWKPEGKDQSGEPVFIPRPGGTDEDDGVILSPIVPMEADCQAYLVILDAGTFKELARAVVPPGVKMPVTFHGSFIP